MTPRIPPLSDDRVDAQASAVFRQVERALGTIPNLHRALAHSPAALRAYQETTRHLAAGVLPAKLRERIALTVAAHNACGYCAAAHTELGRGAGLDDGELTRSLRGESQDSAATAALAFVSAVLDRRGRVDDATVDRVRAAGFDDAAIVELLAHVGMNVFTNWFNLVARTPVDFPPVDLGAQRPEVRR